MKKIKKNQKLVVMVTTHKGYHCYRANYLDYDDPRINSIRPCIQQADGSLKDLRTGDDVPFSKDTADLWNVSTGTVFEYPDGKRLLVSRLLFEDRAMIVLDNGFVFNPQSMALRKIKEEVETKEKTA